MRPLRFSWYTFLVPEDLVLEFIARMRAKLAAKSRQEGDCILWTGSIYDTGYGVIRIATKTRAVHRIAYQLAYGSIEDGMDIHHTCRNRACINPDHLEALTRQAHNHKTHRLDACRRGHPYNEENTYWTPNGARQCKACRKMRDRKSTRLNSSH